MASQTSVTLGRSLLSWVGLAGGARRSLQQAAPPANASGEPSRIVFGGYEVELAAGRPPAGLTIRLDSSGVPERERTAGVRGNKVRRQGRPLGHFAYE